MVKRREAIIDGTVSVLLKLGLAKMTLDDVAVESGVSRATVYRYFPGGRDELLDALVLRELEQFVGGLSEAVQGQDSLDDLLVAVLMRGHRQMVENRLLQVTWESEPNELLARLNPRSYVLEDVVLDFLVDQLSRVGHPADEVAADADYLQRMVLSFLDNQGSWDLGDEAAVRRLVETQFLSSIGLESTE
jgi:AcrR family transcriptional regulator